MKLKEMELKVKVFPNHLSLVRWVNNTKDEALIKGIECHDGKWYLFYFTEPGERNG